MDWISIQERKPPNDVSVLIAKCDSRVKVKMYFIQIASRINDAWIDDHNGELIHPKYGTITHWMPLPDKPSEK
jgi:uncharacterized protein DUF551